MLLLMLVLLLLLIVRMIDILLLGLDACSRSNRVRPTQGLMARIKVLVSMWNCRRWMRWSWHRRHRCRGLTSHYGMGNRCWGLTSRYGMRHRARLIASTIGTRGKRQRDWGQRRYVGWLLLLHSIMHWLCSRRIRLCGNIVLAVRCPG